jgi:hypothetical protein
MGVNESSLGELGRAWLVRARLVYFEARLELELVHFGRAQALELD